MAQMYFSKFNINSEIYEVYKDDNIRIKILDDILNKMDAQAVYEEEDNQQTTKYKFCDLSKNYENKSVAGRLVKIFKGELQSYDEKQDTVNIVGADDCASSCTFYFDLKTEEIAFITRRDFGYNQFNKYFKILLETYFDDISFEIFLENNIDELKEKIYSFKKILSAEVIIVPPNANTEDFDKLFGTTAQEFKESNATKYTQRLEVSSKSKQGINPKNSFFERMFFGVGKGYGEMTVKGRNKQDEIMTITSSEDTPYKRQIPDIEKDSIVAFAERAASFIKELVLKKMELNLNENKTNKGSEQ
ncbi:hypothetical protein PQ689_03270 [Thermoanaerobacterium thermosaccharolyticum]|uniref:hypothetical protein n=1 Tax=Thermoanaerobacterium thermosaccharolyticum TaxID=1517 RepID=UPI003D2BE5C2